MAKKRRPAIWDRLEEAWERGFQAAEANDCCGCNLRYDEDSNLTMNPYAQEWSND